MIPKKSNTLFLTRFPKDLNPWSLIIPEYSTKYLMN